MPAPPHTPLCMTALLSGCFDQAERAHFAQRGWLLRHGVTCRSDNADLLAIARALGDVSMRALPHRSGLVERHGVQRVEALAEAPRDQFDQILKSGHHGAFPLHSDEAFLEDPCRFVLLHCWRADPEGGGESLLAWRSAIEASADLPTLLALRAHAFAYPVGDAPVLSPQLLRYNRAEIEGQARRSGRALPEASRSWLDRFDALFDSIALEITLKEGDALIESSDQPVRLMAFGGQALEAQRFMVWNFVSTRRDRIEQAREAWQARQFPDVPGETEWIPFP